MSDPILDYEDIERELRVFEMVERRRLGLEEVAPVHWHDPNPQAFSRDQRETTTILLGGLTLAHDMLLTAALGGLGYTLTPLECPDVEALRFGKEFGNRGQCNPTYFTVGNLIKHLSHLRDQQGMPVQEIIDRYVFLTAGACGPCRFGTYVTEYRKALVDSGFEGFRVLLFQQQGGIKQATGEASGLEINSRFFKAAVQAVMVGDCLNLAGYRIRPYEVNTGDTDAALEKCKTLLSETMRHRRSLIPALLRCRRTLNAVTVNRLRPKPKVSIIGEFWAMTTEGDGNHRLQRFLEAEGAEVDIQPVTAWILYVIWEHQHDTRKRLLLRGEDDGTMGLKGKDGRDEAGDVLGSGKSGARAVRGLCEGDRAQRLSLAGDGSDCHDLAPVLRQSSARRRGPHGSGQAHPKRGAPQVAHGHQREALRLHAVIRCVGRHSVVDHRALSRGHLYGD